MKTPILKKGRSLATRTFLRSFLVMALFFIAADNSCAQWVPTNGPKGAPIHAMVMTGANLFAGTWSGGIYRSTDQGTTWASVGLLNKIVQALAVSPSGAGGMDLYAGTLGGVYLSTSSGDSWNSVGTLPYYVTAFGFIPNGSGRPDLLVGTVNAGAYLHTDHDTGWTAVNTGLPYGAPYCAVTCFAVSGSNIYCGTAENETGIGGNGVYVSTNRGATWTAINTGMEGHREIESLFFSGSNLFAAAGVYAYRGAAYIYVSTNFGTNWSQVNLNSFGSQIYSVLVRGTQFIAVSNLGVFVSTDSGVSWRGINDGLNAYPYLTCMALSDTNIFVGSGDGVVYRRPLAEISTSVESSMGRKPRTFLLEQNYPNPFNPSSEIRFQISEFSNVRLVVYDILGREVAVLVNEKKAPGSYEVRFDGSGLASGVYVYRLTAGRYAESRRMLLIK